MHDDTALRRFHEIGWRAEMEDGRPWQTFQSYDEMAIALRHPSPGQRSDAVGIFDGDRMVGGGIAWLSLDDNVDKAFVFPCVEPELRRRGIGGELLEALVEHVRGLGRTEVMSGTSYRFEEREDSPLLRFAAAHGFAPANLEVVRQLTLPVADALLDEIDAEVAAHADGYEVLSFVDDLPDELLESYCYLVNQLALDAPTGDLDFEEETFTPRPSGTRWHATRRSAGPCCAASRSRTGRPSPTATCCCVRPAPAPCSGRRSSTATTGDIVSVPRSRSPTCAGCSASDPTSPMWSPRTPRSTSR